VSGERPPGSRRTGPLLLLLASLLPTTVLVVLLARPRSSGEVAVPEVSDPDQSVPALVAVVAGPDGSRLEARLTPLHADPQRQAFEGGALRDRLHLGDGAPWRLSVEWFAPEHEAPPPEAPGGAAAGRFGDRGPARGEPGRAEVSAIGLGAVQVVDERGTALASIDPPADGDRDPVRTLCAPPGGALRQGQASSWVLWGRAPQEGARLVGLLPPPEAAEAEDFAAATGLRGPLRFAAGAVSRRSLSTPLARLDRGNESAPTRGKNPEPAASQQER